VLSFLVRRLPWVLVTYAGGGLSTLRSWKEAAFVGWLGPSGSASAYYAMIIAMEWEKISNVHAVTDPATSATWRYRAHASFHLILFFILVSLILHGLFGPAAARLLRRFQPPKYREQEKQTDIKEEDRVEDG
jgi:NhaP-type Na+/H+ or K+/H+ antiporter